MFGMGMLEMGVKEFFKFLRQEGVIVELIQEENGHYGIKFKGFNSKYSKLVYEYFYKFKRGEI